MMNNTELLEDSPNGYKITSDQPRGNVEKAIEYYLQSMEKFSMELYPMEYGITNYGLARLLFEDRVNAPNDDEKAKRIENSLFYFTRALDSTFNRRDYPMMHALICVYIARLFRDRSYLISHRSFLQDRGSASDSLQYGIDQAVDALPLYTSNRAFLVENSICCLELGYLTMLQLELPEHCEDNSLREQAVGYLERAISISQEVKESVTYKQENGKAVKWFPVDQKTFPKHVQLLLDGFGFNFIEGCAYYVLGRVEEGWNFNSEDFTEADKAVHRRNAFEHYALCMKPKYLNQECDLWGDAHHRSALLIIKFPTLVDDEYDVDERGIPYSDLYLEMATSHLSLALRCKKLSRFIRMDCHFHLAQTYITKLQFIIDRVPYGESVTKAIMESDGLDMIQNIEKNLKESLKRVTAANTQSVQDAYVYYYSSLKIAEYRMLQAACLPELSPEEREEHLRDAVEFVVDACLARSLPNNMDLHYVSNVQLAQMLAAVKRGNAACKSYAKNLMILSALANRAVFNDIYFEGKLLDDIYKHTSQAVYNSNKEIEWVKLHLGPTVLHERVAAGYASWSFEDITSSKYKDISRAPVPVINDDSSIGGLTKVVKATPPKSVPPLQLSTVNLKKVYISGEDIPDHLIAPVKSEADMEFPPPEGPVPLSALGHNPAMRQNSLDTLTVDNVSPSIGEEEPRLPNSPYIGRLRVQVPPLSEIKEIDKYNRAAYSLPKGKLAYLMPLASPVKKAAQNVAQNQKLTEKQSGSKLQVIKEFNEGKDSKSSKAGADEQSKVSESDNGHLADDEGKNEDDSVSGMDSTSSARIMKSVKGHWDDRKAPKKNDDSDSELEEKAEEIETRPRSKKIKPPVKPVKKVHEKVGVLSWLAGKKKSSTPQTQSSPKSQKRSLFSSLFSSKKKRQQSAAIKKKESKPKSLSDEIGFWASRQAFYIFMVLSRMSRMELTLRAKRLEILKGERCCAILYKAKPKYLSILFQLRSQLLKACDNLIVTPSSLKEVSHLSSDELKILFTSHAKIAARLDDLEYFLYFKMSKIDYFMPMIGTSPSFSRDINSYDEALLNAELLMANISIERNLAIVKENQKQGNIPKVIEKTPPTKYAHSYDSVSSNANSSHSHVRMNDSYSKPLIVGGNIRLSNAEKKQAEEEKEEIHAGKMTYALSQVMDGCGYLLEGQQGAKDFLLQSLANDECMMIWHLPSVSSQHLVVVLIWRENSQSLHSHYSAHQAYEARLVEEEDYKQNKRSKAKANKKKKSSAKGIVVEVAKSDLDASHTLQHIQRYLDALHAKPAPKRIALATDALKNFSCALSISELLLMIPATTKSIIICCNPIMRMIPWHLLLYEDTTTPSPSVASNMHSNHSNDSLNGVTIRHLAETYKVRLGPSLSLFELCITAASKLRQTVGLHRMCAVDGDDRDKRQINTKSNHGGVRGADLEVSCVTTTWSADPDDSYILQDEAASPPHLETVYFGEDRLNKYRKFKKQLVRLRGEVVVGKTVEQDMKAMVSKSMKVTTGKSYSQKRKPDDDDDDASEGSDKEGSEVDEDVLEELKAITEEQKINTQSLTACRVLHLAANKVPLDPNLTDKHGTKIHAAVYLPKDHEIINDNLQQRATDSVFSATDLVKQIYVKNCALCVLSRFGLTDDVVQVDSLSADSNWEFVEAVHVAGACSVLVPLWYRQGGGLSTLSNLLFLIRFYSILPSKSRDRLSIIETVRRVQLWLKDVSANDVIAFVHKAPIPPKARESIIAEMESYVQASNAPAKKKQGGGSVFSQGTTAISSPTQGVDGGAEEGEGDGKGGNREGGERKFFSHFLFWGAYSVSGYGGGVHHPDLTKEHEEEGEGFGDGLWGDEELNNIIFEASVLRMEGKIKEAVELERHIRHLRIQKMKSRYEKMKATGWMAGRTILDTVDYFDKLLLAQDSDEVSSVSSDSQDSEDEGGEKKKKEKKKKKKKDEKGIERNDSLLSSPGLGEEGDSSRLLLRPLDLDRRNSEVEYAQWKEKVGGLNMNVKAVDLKKTPSKVSRSVKGSKQPTPKKPDNYEFSLLNAMDPVPLSDDDSGNSSDGGKKKKKKEEEKKSVWKEVFGGVRSYGEIAKMIAEQAPEIQPPNLPAPNMKKEDCIIS